MVQIACIRISQVHVIYNLSGKGLDIELEQCRVEVDNPLRSTILKSVLGRGSHPHKIRISNRRTKNLELITHRLKPRNKGP